MMNLKMNERRFTGELQLTSNGDDAKSAKVKIVARRGTPINHPFWGNFVHDFSGMRHKPRIPLDYAHADQESIGYLNSFDVSSGDLIVSGAIVPFNGDKGAEVIHKINEGVPYQASIEWGPDYLLEYIPEGVVTYVNPSPDNPEGIEVVGPCSIIREWELRAVAICKFGADDDTTSELQLSKNAAEKTYIRVSGDRMTEPEPTKDVTESAIEPATETDVLKSEAEPLHTDEQHAEAKAVEAVVPAEAIEPEQQAPPEALTELKAVEASDPRAEARKFIELFGELSGAKYFAQGLSLSDATTQHLQQQSKQIDELTKRLATVDRGATEPLRFSDESKGTTKGTLSDVISINSNRKRAK